VGHASHPACMGAVERGTACRCPKQRTGGGAAGARELAGMGGSLGGALGSSRRWGPDLASQVSGSPTFQGKGRGSGWHPAAAVAKHWRLSLAALTWSSVDSLDPGTVAFKGQVSAEQWAECMEHEESGEPLAGEAPAPRPRRHSDTCGTYLGHLTARPCSTLPNLQQQVPGALPGFPGLLPGTVPAFSGLKVVSWRESWGAAAERSRSRQVRQARWRRG